MKFARREFLATLATAGAVAAQDLPVTSKRVEVNLPAGPLLPPEKITGPFAGMRWSVRYLFDEDDAELVLNDFVFSSPQRGFAVGQLDRRNGSTQPSVLLTHDGGRHWTTKRVKDTPFSIFPLDDSRLFMVGDNALWYSAEGGVDWEKRKLPKVRGGRQMLRCHFLDEKHGWVFGEGKIFFVTTDGGLSWSAVPESSALNLKDEHTTLTWGTFTSPNNGVIIGHAAAPKRDGPRFPDWMMPERATRANLHPSSTVFLQTTDQGKTWSASLASMFGTAVRLRSHGIRALVIYDYGDGFQVPSEVYEFDLRTGYSSAAFRRQNLSVSDAMPISGGGVLLACIESAGKLRNSPFPGKLRMLLRTGAGDWYEMKVDYRAVGRRATLSCAGDNDFWVATSEGVILHLELGPKP